MDRNRRFDGRVAIVTGGSRGIGKGIAMALAAEGAIVAIGSRDIATCESTAREVEAAGGQAAPYALDVTDYASCEAVVAAVAEELGRPTLLVNSAGISTERRRAEHHGIEAWDRTIGINLTGSYYMCRACAPQLLDGGGAVLNIGSTTARFATPRIVAYGASKAAVEHMTKTLAHEWADRGVRVNALDSGYVATDLSTPLLNVERHLETIVAATPLGRIAELQEIVAPALFLLSDEASFVTGESFAADGGMATRGGPT